MARIILNLLVLFLLSIVPGLCIRTSGQSSATIESSLQNIVRCQEQLPNSDMCD